MSNNVTLNVVLKDREPPVSGVSAGQSPCGHPVSVRCLEEIVGQTQQALANLEQAVLAAAVIVSRLPAHHRRNYEIQVGELRRMIELARDRVRQI